MGPYRSDGYVGGDYDSRVYSGKSYTKFMVTVSSCLYDQSGVQGSNKAGVEREAANQGRDGLVPAQLSERERESGKVNNSTFFFFSSNPLQDKHKHNKVLMGDGFIKTKSHKMTFYLKVDLIMPFRLLTFYNGDHKHYAHYYSP